MAVDVFLVTKDIKGEASDSEFPEAIEVSELHWGIQGAGHNATRDAEVRNVTIRKAVDRASPTLWWFCTSHTNVKEMALHFRKAGKTPLTYLTLTLKNVYVVSTDLAIGAGGEDPEEIVELDFLSIEAEYQPQSKTGGKSGGTVSYSWQGRES